MYTGKHYWKGAEVSLVRDPLLGRDRVLQVLASDVKIVLLCKLKDPEILGSDRIMANKDLLFADHATS